MDKALAGQEKVELADNYATPILTRINAPGESRDGDR